MEICPTVPATKTGELIVVRDLFRYSYTVNVVVHFDRNLRSTWTEIRSRPQGGRDARKKAARPRHVPSVFVAEPLDEFRLLCRRPKHQEGEGGGVRQRDEPVPVVRALAVTARAEVT